tara:strand:+ start:45 stop:209 length:165 start_codon:yes stop_codon:yes gene_type:complete
MSQQIWIFFRKKVAITTIAETRVFLFHDKVKTIRGATASASPSIFWSTRAISFF